MIKWQILEQLANALHQAAPELNNLSVDDTVLSGFRLERPRNPEHGDYAVNVSFLARHTKLAPPKIAEILSRQLAAVPVGVGAEASGELLASQAPFQVQVVGGYLNFRLTDPFLAQALAGLIQNPQPGKNESQAGQRVLLEYVSANPTGPLHIGHGRWAALGDSVVRILRYSGAFVTPEFYINDFGFQMEKLALSVWWRSVELLKNEGALAGVAPETNVLGSRELPYPGDFVITLAADYLAQAGQREAVQKDWQAYEAHKTEFGCDQYDVSDLAEWSQSIKTRIIERVAPGILAGQQALLQQMRVTFDVWTSEKQALHEAGEVERTLETLKSNGYSYEADGALWFKSEQFGDEKDRVLKKSDGSYTYLAADIAYHNLKYKRPEGYNRIMNIWGADHHGYIARMRGAIQALGHNPEQFEVLLGQLVNLLVDGERTRMGKRRKMLTLQDVVDEVGVDATRFWMVSKSADSPLDFDVDLAASASSDNPVFYVQYAHARCCSILRNATEPAPNVDTGEIAAPYVQPAELEAFEKNLTPAALAPLFDSLTEERDKGILKVLLLMLDGFDDVVADAARLRAPHFICQYCLDVAASFHSFYNVCRILTLDAALTQARLMLIRAIQKTLAQALDLLGVSAPEKM